MPARSSYEFETNLLDEHGLAQVGSETSISSCHFSFLPFETKLTTLRLTRRGRETIGGNGLLRSTAEFVFLGTRDVWERLSSGTTS